MKLYLYELYKIFAKRTVWLLTAALLVAGAGLFWVQKRQDDKWYLQRRPAQAAMEQKYMDADYEAVYAEIKELYDDLNAIGSYSLFKRHMEDEPFFQDYIDDWNWEHPGLLEKYAGSPYLTDDDLRNETQDAISGVVTQLEHITGYRDFVLGMQTRAEQMKKVSIFQKQGSFSYNNILRTPQDFLPLADLPLKLGDEHGVVAVTDYRLPDILLPGSLFVFCIYLFLHERETGLDKLVKTAKRGRFATIAAKLGALMTLSVVLALIFYGSILVIGHFMYGYGDLSRYVQSMPSFRDCTLPISVGQYLALFLACKTGAALLTAVLMALMFTLFGEGKSVFVVLGVFTGVSCLCYLLIHPASWANLAKYVNIFSAWDVYESLRLYININFFTLPFNRLLLCGIAGIIVFAAAIVVTCVAWTKHLQVGFVERLLAALSAKVQKRIAGRPIRGQTSLLAHESRKLLVTGKAWLFIAAALVIAWNSWDTKPLTMGMLREASYKLYANYWSGPLTDEKIAEIEAENAYIHGISAQLEELAISLRTGKITQGEYASQYNRLYNYQQNRSEGFQIFYRQYANVLSLPKWVEPAIVDRLSTDYWCDNEERDLLRGLLFVLLTVLALGRVFPLDEEKGLYTILRCTKNGRRELTTKKLVVSLGCTFLLWLILYVPGFATLLVKYNVSFVSDLQNIALYENIPLRVSVGVWFALLTALQLVGAATAAVWTLNLTRLAKKQSLGVILSAVVLAFPFLILLLGVGFMRWFGLAAAFTPYQAAKSPQFLWIYAIGLCAVCAAGVWWMFREGERR